MPNRTLTRIAKKLSTYYYAYGKLVASKTYLLLVFSLSFISYFSIAYVYKSLVTVTTPTTHNNIPLSQISTSLDAHCWHASAHAQFNNFTNSRSTNLPTHYLITERLRLSIPDQPVTFELIQQAKAIYTSITTSFVLDGKSKPVSLENICYQHEGHCLVHAPPFAELNDEKEWRKRTNIHNQPKHQYEQHPYSIYSNTTFDFPSGEFIKADAILLTFVLKQTQNGNTLRIWNSILQQVKEKYHIVDAASSLCNQHDTTIWYASSNTSPQMIQYKFNLFPYEVSYKVQMTMVVYLIMFYLVSLAFGKSNLVKSGYTFGLAAVFLSIACFTTTWGIFIKLDISLNSVPWYLLLLSVNIGSLENVFLLTNAVLYAGCDMIVKEKVSRGLQSVGVPMTMTLMAELFILTLGTQMDTALIKEFCMFTKVALCVDYLLEMTFVIAVLSIDIKRVELADLDDRQMSKRLHELAAVNNSNNKKDVIDVNQQGPDFCPVQDTPNKEDSKSCAECKDFKTHRVLNALMICFIVLFLTMFCSKGSNHHHHKHNQLDKNNNQPELVQLSDQFWSTVNPEKDVTWLQIQPPHLFIYDHDPAKVSKHVEQLQQLYLAKSMVVRTKIEHRPSLFRQFILSSLQNALIFLLHINVPLLMLCLVTVGIITWMTPKWRDQWLLPLMTRAFNQFILTSIRWFPSQFIKKVYSVYFKGQPWYSSDEGTKEYDADGIHHRGAISVQNTFNQQQYRANVKQVQVRTLTNHHVADIQNLDANAKSSLVSCGQDGRIVLWNASKATWMARLDKLSNTSKGGLPQATLNPAFYTSHHHHSHTKKKKLIQNKKQQQQKRKNSASSSISAAAAAAAAALNASTTTATATATAAMSSAKNYLSRARCVKVDQGNKWIAAGYDDGVIRIWNVSSGTLVREMELNPHLPSVIEVQQEQAAASSSSSSSSSSSFPSTTTTASSSITTPKLRNRFNNTGYATFTSFTSAKNTHQQQKIDRILFIQFMGVIAEYCHPLVAEAAARSSSNYHKEGQQQQSQNFIVSAHKSGLLLEWDIVSGECIQTIKTGHTRDITQLHIVDAKQVAALPSQNRKFAGISTWIFTASKDGTVKCWERRLVVSSSQETDTEMTTRWNLAYTIEQSSPVTSIATEIPVGGMGVLITGCSDGSVRVWNFETGKSIYTLSMGKSLSNSHATSSSSSTAVAANQEVMIGGPIRKFSKFSSSSGSSVSHTSHASASTYSSSASCPSFSSSSDSSSSSEETESESINSVKRHRHRHHHHHPTAEAANHRAAIYQVVVTRYCEVENGPGLCRGCDTCFGNGFLVASSSMDNKVHAWRLERADNGHEGSCTLCTKDYHRKQYKHRKASLSSSSNKAAATDEVDKLLLKPTSSNRRRRSPSLQQQQQKRQVSSTGAVTWNGDLSTLELLDIEQLAGDAATSHIVLKPTFLGKVDQPAGCGVVFCDKILAGVRRVRHHHSHHSHSRKQQQQEEGEWEAWFASLQYYEPSSAQDQHNSTRIPIETFSLDHDTPVLTTTEKTTSTKKSHHHHHHKEEELTTNKTARQLLKSFLVNLFASNATGDNKKGDKYKRSATTSDCYSSCSSSDTEDDDMLLVAEEVEELHDLEASEILPFSAVRHIIPLDGSGLACDFGNFIKLVYLGSKMSLSEKERLKQTREALELAAEAASTAVSTKKKSKNGLVFVEEEETEHRNCQCDEDGIKGMDGCCGGVNKEKNGGQCCGGSGKNVKKLQAEKRRQKATFASAAAAANASAAALSGASTTPKTAFVKSNPNTCGGVYSIADCSLRNNCSRASDCSSVVNAARRTPNTNYAFSNWL